MASISPLTSYLLSSIPIPANTRGIPVSSFAPHSPPTGTSPRTSSFSFSTSPSTSYLRNASGVFQGIARQLTAFLPPDYPTEEDHEKRQGKTKVLLLENVNLDAAEYLKNQGYEVSIQMDSSCSELLALYLKFSWSFYRTHMKVQQSGDEMENLDNLFHEQSLIIILSSG